MDVKGGVWWWVCTRAVRLRYLAGAVKGTVPSVQLHDADRRSRIAGKGCVMELGATLPETLIISRRPPEQCFGAFRAAWSSRVRPHKDHVLRKYVRARLIKRQTAS